MARDDVSTRFPFINLEKSLVRAGQLFQGDKSGKPMLVVTAFELWGYSPKSSGGHQTTGALKGYGLIEDEGSNDDRRVRLTETARRYFLDERDEVRAKMLETFALTPPLFRALWFTDKWNEGVPADTVARSHLKIDRHLNEQSARAALSIFKDNLKFAGLRAGVQVEASVESDQDEEPYKKPPETDKGQKMQEAMSGHTPPPMPPAPSGSAKPILYDMETLTVSGQFVYQEEVDDFVEKMQRIKALMPKKPSVFD